MAALHVPTACVLKLSCTPETIVSTKYLIILAGQLYKKLRSLLETSCEYHKYLMHVSYN
jgi:hypothetical protein